MGSSKVYFPRLLEFHHPTQWAWLNGIRTKLLADQLELSVPILFLLGQGVDLYYRTYRYRGIWSVSAKSPQFLLNLSTSLGIYMEEFRVESLERLRNGVESNLEMRWLPLLELSSIWLGERWIGQAEIPDLILPVVGKTENEPGLILIHPQLQEYLDVSYAVLQRAGENPCTLPTREQQRGWRWLMLNSPSFSKPVFPPLRRALLSAIDVWIHRYLYLPDISEKLGLTGRQAYSVFASDLIHLKEDASDAVGMRQISVLLRVIDSEFGVRWGRDLLAQGLREAGEHLCMDTEDAARLYEQASEMWQAFSYCIESGEGVNRSKLCEAAKLLPVIFDMEMQAVLYLKQCLSVDRRVMI